MVMRLIFLLLSLLLMSPALAKDSYSGHHNSNYCSTCIRDSNGHIKRSPEDKTKTNIAYVIDVTLIDFVVMKNNDREISEKDWFIYTQQKVEKQKRKKKQ